MEFTFSVPKMTFHFLCNCFNLCAIKSCKRVKTKQVQLQPNSISKAKREGGRQTARNQPVWKFTDLQIGVSCLGGGLLLSQMSSLGHSNATEGVITIATAQSPAVTQEWRWVLRARRPLNLGRTSTQGSQDAVQIFTETPLNMETISPVCRQRMLLKQPMNK